MHRRATETVWGFLRRKRGRVWDFSIQKREEGAAAEGEACGRMTGEQVRQFHGGALRSPLAPVTKGGLCTPGQSSSGGPCWQAASGGSPARAKAPPGPLGRKRPAGPPFKCSGEGLPGQLPGVA